MDVIVSELRSSAVVKLQSSMAMIMAAPRKKTETIWPHWCRSRVRKNEALRRALLTIWLTPSAAQGPDVKTLRSMASCMSSSSLSPSRTRRLYEFSAASWTAAIVTASAAPARSTQSHW